MRVQLRLVFLLFMLNGCYTPYNSIEQNDILTNIPFEGSQDVIYIVFPGETLPTEPFVAGKLIRIYPDTSIEKDSALGLMAQEVLNEGLDAIILSKGSFSKWTNYKGMPKRKHNFDDLNLYYLEGVAIKFKENLGYLTYFNKSEQIDVWRRFKGWYNNLAIIEYDIEGNTTYINDTFNLIEYFDSYSMAHLIHEENEMWSMRYNKKGEMLRKFATVDGYVIRKCKIQFDNEGRPSVIRIMQLPKMTNEMIECYYTDSGTIASRRITTKDYGILIENRFYDNMGRLDSCIYLDEMYRKRFRRKWTYFHEEDIMEFDSGLILDSLLN